MSGNLDISHAVMSKLPILKLWRYRCFLIKLIGTRIIALNQSFNFRKMLHTYSLAISPNSEIIQLVSKIKKLLRAEIGESYGSENSQAHITLFMFLSTEENYVEVLEEFKRILAGLKSFELRFSGFGYFLNAKTFYIKPAKSSSKSIVDCCKNINANFEVDVKTNYLKCWTPGFSKPHMSVGRNMKKDWLETAFRTFTEFEQTYTCDAFVIRKLNMKKGQFDVIATIPLLGQKSIDGQQLSLFG